MLGGGGGTDSEGATPVPPCGFVGGWRRRREHRALRCALLASGETSWGAAGWPPPCQAGPRGCLSAWGWLRCSCGRAELPLPLCSPRRGVRAGAGGGCSTAAPEEMGRESPGGGKPLQQYSLASPRAARGPRFPRARCPAEISPRLAGLDGQPEEAARTGRRGRPRCLPGNPPGTGTAAAPARGTVPAQPSPCSAAAARGRARRPNPGTGFGSCHGGTRPAPGPLRSASPCAEPGPSPTGAASSAHAQPSARDERGLPGGRGGRGRQRGGHAASRWRGGSSVMPPIRDARGDCGAAWRRPLRLGSAGRGVRQPRGA